jgi:hypothetical protein
MSVEPGFPDRLFVFVDVFLYYGLTLSAITYPSTP